MCVFGYRDPRSYERYSPWHSPPVTSNRAILESIEEKLRPGKDTADGRSPSTPETAALGGPTTVEVAPGSPVVAVMRAGSPKTSAQPVPSTPRPGLPAGRRKSTNCKHFHRLGFRPTPTYRARGDRQASSRFNGKEQATETGRMSRTASGGGGAVGPRSVGTVVAHFPTASAAKSARGRKATMRAWA